MLSVILKIRSILALGEKAKRGDENEKRKCLANGKVYSVFNIGRDNPGGIIYLDE